MAREPGVQSALLHSKCRPNGGVLATVRGRALTVSETQPDPQIYLIAPSDFSNDYIARTLLGYPFNGRL